MQTPGRVLCSWESRSAGGEEHENKTGKSLPWEVVGEITRKELVKKYGAGTYGTITKVGRPMLADKEGIKL